MKRYQRKAVHAARSGFTLLELLIVLGIIVALAAMVAPNLLSSGQEAKESIARADIANIEGALKRKAVHNDNTFPSGSSEIIQALAEVSQDSRGKDRPPYLEKVPVDPWGNPYMYEYDPQRDLVKPRIWSIGLNKQDEQGSGDDIPNWPVEGKQ